MKVAKQLTVLGIFLSFAIQVSTTPLHIGAFNLHIFGQSKFSESEVVSIISKVSARISDCIEGIRLLGGSNLHSAPGKTACRETFQLVLRL